jgi:ankyrin repeat protein
MDLYSALKSGSPQELLAFAKIDPNQDYSSWIHTHFDRNDGICEGSTLHVASASGSDALVEMLVNFGADPNVVDCDGDTPLHWACANDYPDVVRMLLQKGANVEVANDVMKRFDGFFIECL